MDHPVAESTGQRYVLITQCLQNDFFFSSDCRLVLPQRVVSEMLLPKPEAEAWAQANARSPIPAKTLATGPLGRFLAETIGRRLNGKSDGTLHVINIRDWHEPGPNYDQERRSYGPHCEPGTTGAAYIQGLERYLNPRSNNAGAAGERAQKPVCHIGKSVCIYHVHSDSVFDFKPQSGQQDTPGPKHRPSQLEQLLDVLIQGSDDDVEKMSDRLGHSLTWPDLSDLAEDARDWAENNESQVPHLYVAVIGVYTDIKVLTLLAGLRTRYNIANLAVSDTLTASPTLERHLAGLDFASKVLGIDVVHGLNDLMRYLGNTRAIKDEAALVSSAPYSQYQTFFQDKQNVMAYQDEKLREYVALTERRSLDVYERIKRANQFLIWFGSVFLVFTLVASILSAIFPDSFDWRLPLVTGSVSILQLIGAFYTKPIHDLQQNLANLATFKMVLESHSLKMAFARFHLTTPQALREIRSAEQAADASLQIASFREQVEAIQSYDKLDFESLAQLAAGTQDAVQSKRNG